MIQKKKKINAFSTYEFILQIQDIQRDRKHMSASDIEKLTAQPPIDYG